MTLELLTTLPLKAQSVFEEQLRIALRTQGDVAELGVWRGASGLAMAIIASGRTVHLFDTFTGMPATNPAIDFHRKGDFSDTQLNQVQKTFIGFPNVKIYAGRFPETMPRDLPRLCFVHLDADLYQSTADGLKHFFPLLNPGGRILIDDYGRSTCQGVSKAVDEFSLENNCEIVEAGICQVTLTKC